MVLTFRAKIIGLSAGLLAMLCLSLLVGYRAQQEVYDEIVGITEYHIPLGALIAEVDEKVAEYELNLYRLLARDDPAGASLDPAERTSRELMATINSDLDRIGGMITSAVADERNDLSDRLVMSRIQGMVAVLRRQTGPIEELGVAVLEAHRRGDAEEARRLLTRFEGRTDLLNPDIFRIRAEIQGLTLASATETAAQQEQSQRFGLFAFLVAAALGLGFATLIASRLVVGLRRLVEGARAVESGSLAAPLPVTSRDEVGQLTYAFNHMVGELKTRDTIRDTFGKFVDPRIVSKLISTTGDVPETAERRIATVFFSDIAGFSSISEQLTATVIANLLNRWFTLSTDAIRAHHGVVDKYIGDSVMAFWAAPFSTGDDHAAEACLAALAQQEAAEVLRSELPQLLGLRRNLPEIGFRMGLATGEVVIGAIGSATTRSFTVIGDTANLASRLEGINKVYGTRIIVAEDTFRLAQGAVAAREIDLITVAGKSEPVRIFELLGRAETLTPALDAARSRFAQALAAYRTRDWTAAEAGFAEVDAMVGGDGPSRLFLGRIGTLKTAPPPADWDGVWRHSKK